MHTTFPVKSIPLPNAISRLSDIAINLWFSWNDSAKSLFASIDEPLWHQVQHNPVRLLMETKQETLTRLAEDGGFLRRYQQVVQQYDSYMQGETWFKRNYPQHGHQAIAYFSAEFGFHESLPIYSGGLGILAGDHCKSASDLGIPLVGVGLMYRKGYFKQKIDTHGNQITENVAYDFNKLPITPVLVPSDTTGDHGQPSFEELYITVPVADRTVRLKVWLVQVGRNPVYLLDADLQDNSPWDRQLTEQLYGGTQDVRIAQEILLGMGGLRALRALGIPTGAFHINEGHAAFLSFERLREQLDQGVPFHVALEIVRASTVFTTHTPVPAGHDAFPMPMYEYYFSQFFNTYGAHKDAMTSLGYDEKKQLFNMTHLALHTAALRNGVSKLHGHVSRDMFRELHGHIDVKEVPIEHITNGVHMSTWLAAELKELFSRFMPGYWLEQQTNRDLWHSVTTIPDASLWGTHEALKEKLIREARANLREQRRRNGMSADRIDEVKHYLSKDALTIGFARRFATYKRATLLFNNLDRLDRIVNNPERPVQFIFAGKAHPADMPGQDMIRHIHHVSQMDRFRGKIVMLENYDMDIARALVQGVDVWMNNPRRPYEASGTSGQKAAMNGVINFSVLDGWWEEGYDGTNGWSILANPDGDDSAQDQENTESIYHVLEHEIVPLYYDRHNGIPSRWVEKMKRSIETLAPVYNTDRMVMDYTNGTYIPTLSRIQRLVADQYAEATRVADFKQFIRSNWHQVRVLEVNDGLSNGKPNARPMDMMKEVTATISFGPVWHRDAAVDLIYYEERPEGWEQVTVPMEPARQLSEGTFLYRAQIPAHLRHGAHFSVRVHPISDSFAHRFELPLIKRF
ncbi:alpha-glucan family phosphorylase [Paenibacillus sp. YYML68]|uniref:alpha-glucan family phosphorylase n=1 Tax=Paenibacillus sp. YYML68 TaxID=2909250 RepID=UPI0024931760|nr:alpha-glucan family phosphorylase [Paenibacillus sp. YYML68]